ncbi:hypothetical protein OnM2_083046 [Erysiphe neolycopersici]|uniref:Uncharacterized protein n=1 Tax=Erysiphe neolycopersici TaxID=212602 RepID=A0A420HFP0_9PEZI|nr:hypothetical protein OnM2_083046 [Erysiphe neolycopersici]
MRRTVLAILISTLVFSFGVVDAANPFLYGYEMIKGKLQNKMPFRKDGYQRVPSPVNGNGGVFTPIYDAMGIASNVLICNKRNAYYKREAYAAVHQALMFEQVKKTVPGGCMKIKRLCWFYPSVFTPTEDIGFIFPGPFRAFPILPNGKLFTGSHRPINDLVVYNTNNIVVGIVHSNILKYSKCVLDDSYIPKLGFFARLRNSYRNRKITS